MNLKTPSTYLLIIFIALQLASCLNSAPTLEIIPPTSLSTLTPTVTPVPSETPTPQPTGTNTASPTPEVTLIGMVPVLDKFPTLTREEEWKHLQKAIDTRTIKPKIDKDGYANTIMYQEKWNTIGEFVGDRIRMYCRLSISLYISGCAIRDSYQIQTEFGVPIRKILVEFAATFADGTEGSVIYPLIIDLDNYDHTYTSDPDQHTRNIVKGLSEQVYINGVLDFYIICHLVDSRDPSNPAIKSIKDAAFQEGSRTQELLDKMFIMAADGKSLTQEEINGLLDAVIWY